MMTTYDEIVGLTMTLNHEVARIDEQVQRLTDLTQVAPEYAANLWAAQANLRSAERELSLLKAQLPR